MATPTPKFLTVSAIQFGTDAPLLGVDFEGLSLAAGQSQLTYELVAKTGNTTKTLYVVGPGAKLPIGSFVGALKVPCANLTLGGSYSFAIRAIIDGEASPYSDYTAEAVLASVAATTVPSTPTITGITVSGDKVNVSLGGQALASDGTPTHDVRLYLDGEEVHRVSSIAWDVLIEGRHPLINGTAYTVGVRATNTVGTSPESYRDPFAYTGRTLATVPYPKNPEVTGYKGYSRSALVSFSPLVPGDSALGEDDPVAYYVITAGSEFNTVQSVGQGSPILLSGLIPSVPYTLSMSYVSENDYTPKTVPFAAPVTVYANAGNGPAPVFDTAVPYQCKAFRVSYPLGSVMDQLALLNKIQEYLTASGFRTKLSTGTSPVPSITGDMTWLEFVPSYYEKVADTHPAWAICIAPNGFVVASYSGDSLDSPDEDDAVGDPCVTWELGEWFLGGSDPMALDVFFSCDGSAGTFSLYIAKGLVPAGGTVPSWRVVMQCVGVVLTPPLSVFQNAVIPHPHYGLYSANGLAMPWSNTMLGWYDTPSNVEVTLVSGYRSYPVAPYGGIAATEGPATQPAGGTYGRSLSEVYSVPGVDCLPGPMTKLEGVFLATGFGWGNWEQYGPYIITPTLVRADGQMPRQPRLALPCPVAGPEAYTPESL